MPRFETSGNQPGRERTPVAIGATGRRKQIAPDHYAESSRQIITKKQGDCVLAMERNRICDPVAR